MGPYRLVYANRAESDLDGIREHLVSDAGPGVAIAVLALLKRRIETLVQNAHRFRIREELGPDQRALLAAPYIVFYVLRDGTVYIQRILHQARDISSALESGN
jgi:plasmid stabilization system protein ParE